MKRIAWLIILFVFLNGAAMADESIDYVKCADKKVRIDIYNPGSDRCPVVILIHGAAGIKGDRAVRYQTFATDLTKRGMIAINVHYLEGGPANWIKSIVETINHAENISNADKERIGLVGYSLGGTIALSAAAAEERVKVLAINSGYMPQGFTEQHAANLPKIFFVTSDQDSAMDTLKRLERWFKKFGTPFEKKIIKGFGHSVPIKIFWETWDDIASFLENNL